MTDSISLSSLLCKETAICFDDEDEEEEEEKKNERRNQDVSLDSSFSPRFVSSADDDDYIEKLIEREIRFGLKSDVLGVSDDRDPSIDKSARFDAIDWILNTRAIFGFQYHTAYLSITYFDRFLSSRSVDDRKMWAVRLLTVACLSIAAKVEEHKVPPLSELLAQDFPYENKVVKRMELLVLSSLDWKMGSITPFYYLNHFISKMYSDSTTSFEDLSSKSVDLVMYISKEINLIVHRPSTIAAAAVLAAASDDEQLTKTDMEIKLRLIPSSGSLENEHIFSCYTLMQERVMNKQQTPPKSIRKTSSSSNRVLTPGAGTKRSLTFNDSDQNTPDKRTRKSIA